MALSLAQQCYRVLVIIIMSVNVDVNASGHSPHQHTHHTDASQPGQACQADIHQLVQNPVMSQIT